MPQLVEIPDVGTVEFPDDATRDEITSWANERYPAKQSLGTALKEDAKSVLHGMDPRNWPTVISDAVSMARNGLGRLVGGTDTPPAEAADALAEQYGPMLAKTRGLLLRNSPEEAEGIAKGLIRSAAGLVFGSPELIAAGAASAYGGAGVAITTAATFAKDMLGGAYASHKAAQQETDPTKKSDLETTAAINALMGLGIALGPAVKQGISEMRGGPAEPPTYATRSGDPFLDEAVDAYKKRVIRKAVYGPQEPYVATEVEPVSRVGEPREAVGGQIANEPISTPVRVPTYRGWTVRFMSPEESEAKATADRVMAEAEAKAAEQIGNVPRGTIPEPAPERAPEPPAASLETPTEPVAAAAPTGEVRTGQAGVAAPEERPVSATTTTSSEVSQTPDIRQRLYQEGLYEDDVTDLLAGKITVAQAVDRRLAVNPLPGTSARPTTPDHIAAVQEARANAIERISKIVEPQTQETSNATQTRIEPESSQQQYQQTGSRGLPATPSGGNRPEPVTTTSSGGTEAEVKFPLRPGKSTPWEDQTGSPVVLHDDPATGKRQWVKAPGFIAGTKADQWAQQTIKRKLSETGANPFVDPEFIAAVVTRGAAIIESGIRDFAAWSAEMVKLYGPVIQNRLEDLYAKAMKYHDDAVASAPSKDVATRSPELRPGGPTTPSSDAAVFATRWRDLPLRQWPEKLAVIGRQAAMQAMPKFTSANREVGEAGVRMAAAHGVSRALGVKFADDVVRKTGVDPIKFGVALSEDNLRDLKETYLKKAADAVDEADAAAFKEAADNVFTFIGRKGSPFETEEAWRSFLNEPDTQRAIELHKQMWAEQKDPLFREANDLDPTLPLATRGKYTGARVNLSSIQELEAAGVEVKAMPTMGSPKLIRQLATIRKRDPFSRQATGLSKEYAGNYYDIMANGFEREYPVAKQHEFIRKAVESGLAVINKSEKPVEIRGETSKAYQLKTGTWNKQWLHVPRSMALEYEIASGLRPDVKLGLFTRINDFFTKQSVQGLAEGTTHGSNLMVALLSAPGPTGSPLLNTALKSVALPATTAYNFGKALAFGLSESVGPRMEAALKLAGIKAPEGMTLSEWVRDTELGLAKISATKQPYMGAISARILNPIDRGVRVTLASVYKKFAEQGLVPDTETGLREFVNQAGNYSKRLQPEWIRILRSTAIQPFATAVHNFNVLGVRRMVGGPGAKATSLRAAALLRADTAATLIGVFTTAAMVNYLLNKGNVQGPKGTPLGGIGLDPKDHPEIKAAMEKLGMDTTRPYHFNLLRFMGFERGPRALGILPYIEARRLGVAGPQAAERAAESVASTGMRYFGGPGMSWAWETATGKRFSYPPIQQAPVAAPGESQILRNMAQGAVDANPISASIVDLVEGKPIASVAQRQFSRFSPTPGMREELAQKLPEIIEKGQEKEFAKDIMRRARNMKPSARSKYVEEQIQKITDPKVRRMVVRSLAREGVL